MTGLASPEWADHAIWWHVYPLGFLGAERNGYPPGTAPVPRLERLERWFDYLIELGCNGLALGPVFAAETHGYDTVDHFTVDPRLGTEDTLARLVEQAAARGIRVLLDGVFNHVGRGFPPFADAQRHGRRSRYAGWFVARGDDYLTFEGHHRLVTLNHDDPEVAGYVTEVMTHWLDRGVAGWRLDAAYAVPTSFWLKVCADVRARFPEAWLVGEVIHGDYATYATEAGLDSVTQYELWKAIWSSLNDGNLFELSWALTRHNDTLAAITPMTFVGNHDVTRIATRVGDRRLWAHALVILLTIGGIPSIYAGDEQAFQGVKENREGGDEAVRPAFPDNPRLLAAPDWSHYRLHQQLIGVRRRNPWLVNARTTMVSLTNTAAAYTVGERPRLLVALNIADLPAELAVPPGDWRAIAGRGAIGVDTARLPATSWAIAVE